MTSSTDRATSARRAIIHVDMDAFFVSVELLYRPELAGLPVVVGGSGSRGVVAAASYEARAHGVYSAMPSVRARRLCPDAVFLPADHDRYRQASDAVMGIFGDFTPMVEPISLDEAFLDVSGARSQYGSVRRIAEAIRRRIKVETRLPCSVGIAPNKFLAKLASEAAKPRARASGPIDGPGIFEIDAGRELEFLHPLPVSSLWGVGPATRARLERIGVTTVGQLARVPEDAVRVALGTAAGDHLCRLASGLDDRPVEPNRKPKSVGHEETFATDRFDYRSIHRDLVAMSDRVASRLRRAGLGGRTVTVKVRFGDFRTITRSVSGDRAIDTAPAVLDRARRLLADVDLSPGIRLLGVSVSGLAGAGPRQLSFDQLDTDDVRSDIAATVDEIRGRFGDDAIKAAVLAAPAAAPRRQKSQNMARIGQPDRDRSPGGR